ncbi:MAG: 2-C-methyl-D-erythritol 2,4-cyclodiphosphate synthase [Candidatus Humimicrobiaceae bacterium]
MRIGIGYDVHALKKGRKLILGGVKIEYHLGLEGHSDSDVLVHAIMDAILGACGLGDIGIHFPDTDPAYKGMSSLLLLKKVEEKMKAKGKKILNIDSTIIMQKPKVSPHVEKMKENIAAALGISKSLVNIKATTTEGLGYCGRGEGIAAQSVVLLK